MSLSSNAKIKFTSSEGIVNTGDEPITMDQQPCLQCTKPEPCPCKAKSLTVTNIRVSPSSVKKIKKHPVCMAGKHYRLNQKLIWDSAIQEFRNNR